MAVKPLVVVDPHFRAMAEIFSPADLARLRNLATVVWGRDQPMSDSEFADAVPDAVAVVCADWRYGDAALKRANRLRSILTVSGGFPRRLDFDHCFAHGIRVLSAAPAFARPVAEMALTMALASARDVVSCDRAFRAGNEAWRAAANQSAFHLYGKPVGMIGYGGIAQALHPLLEPFGVTISAYDPWIAPGYLVSRGVTPSSLDEVLAKPRVIFVLAAPSTDNQALLSREKLELIRPDAVLVLVSRAHVVDFRALTDMVREGRFRAAIDVFPSEPLPAGDPLRGAESAILSAHKAGSTIESRLEIGRCVVDDLEAILAGLPPRRMLNAEPELIGRYVNPEA